MTDDTEPGKAGQLFEDFLREQGSYDQTTEVAVKRVIAHQLAAVMKEQRISKVQMAKRLETSRSRPPAPSAVPSSSNCSSLVRPLVVHVTGKCNNFRALRPQQRAA